jgi:hypothetical protein
MTPYEPDISENIGAKATGSKDPESELGAIKLTRALSDPVIVYSGTDNLPFGSEHEIYEHITEGRLSQLKEVSLNERVKCATVPEVLVYLYTASFEEQNINQEFNRLYGYALNQYQKQWRNSLPDRITDRVSIQQSLEDHQLEKFISIMTRIKSDRDRHFVANKYDALGVQSVPKTFWTEHSDGELPLDANSAQLVEKLDD